MTDDKFALFVGLGLMVGCGSQPPPHEHPPAVTVVAPAPNSDATPSSASEAPPPERATPSARGGTERAGEPTWPPAASLEVTVDPDGGVLVVRTPDGGGRAWGTMRRTDGGFSFKGGFSIGDTGAPTPNAPGPSGSDAGGP